MGPIDYTMQVIDPIQAALQQRGLRFAEEQQVRAGDQQDVALGQGQQRIDMAREQMMMQQAEADRQRQEQAAAQARAEAGQKAFVDFMFAPNKTAEQARSVIEANPEMAQAVMEYWQGQNEEQRSSELAFAKQFAFALNKSPEAAKAMLEERAARLETVDPGKAAAYRAQVQLLDMGEDGVETVKAETLAIMAGVMDPKDLNEFMGAAGYTGLSEEPAAVQALRIRAQEAGLAPGTEEYRNFMMQGGAEKGMALEVLPDGTVRMTEGNVGADPFGGKPATEGQLASAGYLQRMYGAEEILAELEAEGIVALPTIKGPALGTRVEGYVLNDQEQRLEQAKRDWVRAKLRKESGAVIAEEEMAEEIKTYFPIPGEGPAQIAQKRAARIRAQRQMEITSGPAAPMAQLDQSAASPAPAPAPPPRIRSWADAMALGDAQFTRAVDTLASRGIAVPPDVQARYDRVKGGGQ